ncbi:MAG: sulfatase-like hydrolase/transferase, partial [Raoultibacter sp.]
DRGIAQPPRWAGRIAYALIVSAFFSYTLFVVAPFEIVAANGASLIFGIFDVWVPVAVGAAVVTLLLTLLLSILRGRAFEIALLLVFSLGLAAYVQAMFFNTALPAADGVPVVWDDYQLVTALSAGAWIVIIVAPLILRHWFSSACRGLAVAASLCLIVVQSVGLASLFVQPVAQADEVSTAVPVSGKPVATEEGLFDVSPKNNVVVFILDTIDLTDMQQVLQRSPQALDQMTGFTYYPNTIGAMCPTRWAVPFLLTAEMPKEGEALGSYLGRQYSDGAFLPDIVEQDYSVGLYSDSMGLDRISETQMKQMEGLTKNIHPLEDPSVSISESGAVRELWKCALYRDMPWLLKPPFWFYTDEVNAGMVDRANASNLGSVAYTMDDPAYYDGLKNTGLSVVDDGHAGSFKFIHLNGVHRPFYMDENAKNVGNGNSTMEQSCLGSFKIVDEYIQQMKNLGKYDDATIIVTADHGEWYYTLDGLTGPTGPLLIVKPPTSASESEEAVKISDVPASHFDIHPTVIDAIGGDAGRYNGIPLHDLTADPRMRSYIMNACDGKVDVELIEYTVEGDALDFSKWKKSGRVWGSDS